MFIIVGKYEGQHGCLLLYFFASFSIHSTLIVTDLAHTCQTSRLSYAELNSLKRYYKILPVIKPE